MCVLELRWKESPRTLRVYRLVHRGVILLQPFFAFGHCAAEFAVLHKWGCKRGFIPMAAAGLHPGFGRISRREREGLRL